MGLWLSLLLALPCRAATGPYAGLTVAVTLTDHTKASLRELSEYYRTKAAHRIRPDIDTAAHFFFEATEVFSRHFKAALKSDAPEDAARAGADLIALLDVDAAAVKPWGKPAKARVRMGARFLTPDEKPIGKVAAESVTEPFIDGRVTVRDDLYREFEASLKGAVTDFEEALRASPELQAYAARVVPAGPSAPPAAGRALHSDVDEAAHRLPADADRLAVLVASESRFAERDAQAVRAQLLGMGFSSDNILMLTGTSARRKDLLAALNGWLPAKASPASTVLFFYAGPAAELPLSRVLESLDALKTRWTQVVFDARPGLGPQPTKAAVLSGAGEIDESQGHGALTYRFLKGLSEAADKEGAVSAEALEAYVKAGWTVAAAPGRVWVPGKGAAASGRRVTAIVPRPYSDELLETRLPDGVFAAETTADSEVQATRFSVLDSGAKDEGLTIEVSRARSFPEPKELKRRLLKKYDMLQAHGWIPVDAPRPRYGWVKEAIRWEGEKEKTAGWVLLGRSDGRTFQVLTQARQDEDSWFSPRCAVVLESLKLRPPPAEAAP